jgi:hypothetical protein
MDDSVPRSSGPPTRAEFESLRAECARLKQIVETLIESNRETRQTLHVQFTRMSQMQAIRASAS